MKKFVVLLLVMAMASMASAVSVGLEWDVVKNGTNDYSITLTPTGDTTVAAVFINAVDALVDNIASDLPTGMNNSGAQAGSKTYLMHYSIVEVTDPEVAAGGTVVSFDYTGTAEIINILDQADGHPSYGDSFLTLGDASTIDFTGLDPIYVPEPMDIQAMVTVS